MTPDEMREKLLFTDDLSDDAVIQLYALQYPNGEVKSKSKTTHSEITDSEEFRQFRKRLWTPPGDPPISDAAAERVYLRYLARTTAERAPLGPETLETQRTRLFQEAYPKFVVRSTATGEWFSKNWGWIAIVGFLLLAFWGWNSRRPTDPSDCDFYTACSNTMLQK